jgi:hypothetical protein
VLALPSEINLAGYRTLNKTIKWANTQAARKLGEENLMPVKIFKRATTNTKGYRVRQSKLSYGKTKASLWFGFNQVKAGYIGKARETARGVTVGSGRNRRFYPNVAGEPKIRLIKRSDTYSSILYYDQEGHRWKSIREPVNIVSLDDIEKMIPERMVTTMDAELNYIMNVARSRFQKTGIR